MRKIHLMNAGKRNATVFMNGVKAPPPPKLGLPDREVSFYRYVAATEDGLDSKLSEKFGENYAQALIDGDPDVDIEQVGRIISSTDTVYLTSKGNFLHTAPQVVDVIFGPDGSEIERKEPEEIPANIDDGFPVSWTGRKLSKEEAIRKFAFKRTVQLQHTNGLSYDFLYEMAKTLHEENVVVLMGTGSGAKDPLIFQANGTPYRAFLEGRIDGSRYQLLMHLSNMELKAPALIPGEGD
jgi:hypothetical protein